MENLYQGPSGFWWRGVILCIPWFVDASLQSLPPSSHGFLHVSVSLIFLLGHHSYWINELPWWLSGKESICQCRRRRFDP